MRVPVQPPGAACAAHICLVFRVRVPPVSLAAMAARRFTTGEVVAGVVFWGLLVVFAAFVGFLAVFHNSPGDYGPPAQRPAANLGGGGRGGDLDCSDVRRRVWVGSDDPHHLDGDGDGWGCESWG